MASAAFRIASGTARLNYLLTDFQLVRLTWLACMRGASRSWNIQLVVVVVQVCWLVWQSVGSASFTRLSILASSSIRNCVSCSHSIRDPNCVDRYLFISGEQVADHRNFVVVLRLQCMYTIMVARRQRRADDKSVVGYRKVIICTNHLSTSCFR